MDEHTEDGIDIKSVLLAALPSTSSTSLSTVEELKDRIARQRRRRRRSIGGVIGVALTALVLVLVLLPFSLSNRQRTVGQNRSQGGSPVATISPRTTTSVPQAGNIVVPNVVGLNILNATGELQAIGLTNSIDDLNCHGSLGAGHVVGQSPTDGFHAAPDSRINLRVSCANTSIASPPSGSITLTNQGVGSVQFGETEASATAALSAYFGPPTGEPPSGCTSQWTQVEWNDLIVEFLNGTLIGYRYLAGGYSSTQSAAPLQNIDPVPKLSTTTGISLGSTLGQLKTAYPGLKQTGSFSWTSPDGIHFAPYSDTSYPSPPSTPIVEIKIGTCADW